MADFLFRNIPERQAAQARGSRTGGSQVSRDEKKDAQPDDRPKPEIVNSSSDAPVFRADGIQLFGLDAELERKAQAKRDPNMDKAIESWIVSMIGENLNPPNDLGEALKSGIVLCKLVNAIQPGIVKNINMRPIALMEMENIGFYLKACWMLGVPSGELFVTSDLYLKKSIPAVLANLVSVARAAQLRCKDKPQLSILPPVRNYSSSDTASAADASKPPSGSQIKREESKALQKYKAVATGSPAAAPKPDEEEEAMSSGLMQDQIAALKKRLDREIAEKNELKKAKLTMEEEIMKLREHAKRSPEEEAAKAEAEARKASALAEMQNLQDELFALREKNSRKSVVIREGSLKAEMLQKQLEEKAALEEELKKMKDLENEVRTLKQQGADSQALEQEVRTLRDRSYRKSIMLKETMMQAQQLEKKLAEKLTLEEEVKRLKAMEVEVEKLRSQKDKDTSHYEAELAKLKEEVREKMALEEQVKQLKAMESELQRQKAQGVQETAQLEQEVRALRDRNARKSVLLKDTTLRQEQLQAQLAEKKVMEEEVKRLRDLEAEVQRQKASGRDPAALEAQVAALQGQVAEKKALEEEVKRLRAVEAEMAKLKSEGKSTSDLETQARELRRSANRRSLLLAANQALPELPPAARHSHQHKLMPPPPGSPAAAALPKAAPDAEEAADKAKIRQMEMDLAKMKAQGQSHAAAALEAELKQAQARLARKQRMASRAAAQLGPAPGAPQTGAVEASPEANALEEQVQQLREQNARKSVMLKDAAQLQAQMQQQLRERDALEDEVRKLKAMEADIKKLRRQGKDTDTLEDEMTRLQKDHAAKEEALKRADDALQKEIMEKDALEKEVKRLQALELELARVKAQGTAEKSQLEQQLAQLREHNARKSVMLKQTNSRTMELEEQLRSKDERDQADVAAMKERFSQMQEQHAKEVTSLQNQLKRVSDDKAATQARLVKIENELHDVTDQKKKFEAMINSRASSSGGGVDSMELAALRASDSEKNATIKKLNVQLAELAGAKEQLESELASNLESSIANLENIDSLENELKDQKTTNASLEMEIQLLKTQLESGGGSGPSEADYAALEQKLTSLTDELLKLREQEKLTAKLEERVTSLENENIRLKVQLKDQQTIEQELEQLKDYYARTKDLEVEAQALEAEVKRLRERAQSDQSVAAGVDQTELDELRARAARAEEAERQLAELQQRPQASAGLALPPPPSLSSSPRASSSGSQIKPSPGQLPPPIAAPPTDVAALMKQIQELAETLKKERQEKVNITAELLEVKKRMRAERREKAPGALEKELKELRMALQRETAEKDQLRQVVAAHGIRLTANNAAEGLEQAQVQKLENVIHRILVSKPVEFSEVAKLNDVFKTDIGRRIFTQVLKKTMKDTQSLIVSESSFELLLFIFNTVLQNQDESRSKDFLGCKLLMYASCALGTKRAADGALDFIQFHIQGYDIWQNLAFWEEYFWDEVARKYKEQPAVPHNTDNETAAQVAQKFTDNIVPVIISSFAHDMVVTWRLPSARVIEFVNSMCMANNLGQKVNENLASDVKFYESSLVNPQRRRELEQDLKRRFRQSQMFMKTFATQAIQQFGAAGTAVPRSSSPAARTPMPPMSKLPPSPMTGSPEAQMANSPAGPSAARPAKGSRLLPPPANHPMASLATATAAPTVSSASASSAGIMQGEDDDEEGGNWIGKSKKYNRKARASVAFQAGVPVAGAGLPAPLGIQLPPPPTGMVPPPKPK